jgi:ABC-type multidrug transport system fused ATPase/permease subunit
MTVITLAFAVFILPIFKRQTKNNEKLLSLCNENIRGIKIIKSSNSFDLHKRKYLKVASMLKKDDRSINIINALANPAVNFFVSCSTIGIY